METITLLMNEQEIADLKKRFSHYLSPKTPAYALFQIRCSECVITAYQSKKVVFQGKEASFYANGTKATQQHQAAYPQAGSDEVGTGDYFGPICVCASIVKQEQVSLLKELKVNDSKQVNDDWIRQIAPTLMKEITHSLLVLENERYNHIQESFNLNAIKAILHNQTYVHLKNKANGLPDFCIVDQFTPEKSYYRYLASQPQIISNLHFETKAESKYLSVAVSSIIARYAFLQVMDAMSRHYDFDFPKGAGSNVDKKAAEFVKCYSMDELKKVAKLHFKNTQKLKEY